MRMPAIEPSALSDEQRVLDEHVRRMMDGLRTPFTSTDENGALIGPFPVMLRFPGLARPLLEWFTTVTSGSVLATRAGSSNPHHRITVWRGLRTLFSQQGRVGGRPVQERRRRSGRRTAALGTDVGGAGRSRCGGMPLRGRTASGSALPLCGRVLRRAGYGGTRLPHRAILQHLRDTQRFRRPVTNGCRVTVTSGTHGLQEHGEAVGMSSRGAAPRRRCCSHRRG